MTARELYDECVTELKKAKIADAQSDSRLLLGYIAGVTYNELHLRPDTLIQEREVRACRDAVKRRQEHIPLQHITGIQEFMGLEFAVNEHVLIPRQDTETLVEEAMRIGLSGLRILDMCTGSGCILLSLLHYSHACEGVGVDISDEALEVAVGNAKRLGIAADFINSDLFEGLKCKDIADVGNSDNKLKFDLIISNPPYIPTGVIPTLMEEVREHEPHIALDGSDDGLAYYKRIVNESPDFLVTGGRLMVEIGHDQGQAVSRLMTDRGYSEVSVVKDLAGYDRVVRAEWS